MSEKSFKIAMVGPANAGKSVLSNFLTHQLDLTKLPYNPTKGVRILETDVKENVREKNSSAIPRNIAIQLWDLGGDRQNNRYWNAMIYNADAVVIVYDGDRAGQEKDLETLLYFFNQRPYSAILKPVPETRILMVAHHHVSLARSKFAKSSLLPSEFIGKVKEIHTSLVDSTETVREEFEKFVNTVYREASG